MPQYTKEMLRVHIGKWVEVHSCYGVHHGILHRALHDGIIIVHQTSLAGGSFDGRRDIQSGTYQQGVDSADVSHVQFPFPGMFIPYGGLYGFAPLPFGFMI